MTYTKTQWANDTAPAINATNLNNIENGIGDVYGTTGIGTNTWASANTYQIDEVALYNNKLYKNLTGSNTSTTPDSDTTNWQEISLFTGTTKTQINDLLVEQHISNTYGTSQLDGYSQEYVNDKTNIQSSFDSNTGIGYTKFPDGTCFIYGMDHTTFYVGGNNANVRDYVYPFELANNNYACTISKWDGGNGFSFISDVVALKSTTGFRIYAYNNNSSQGEVSGYLWQVIGKWK